MSATIATNSRPRFGKLPPKADYRTARFEVYAAALPAPLFAPAAPRPAAPRAACSPSAPHSLSGDAARRQVRPATLPQQALPPLARPEAIVPHFPTASCPTAVLRAATALRRHGQLPQRADCGVE